MLNQQNNTNRSEGFNLPWTSQRATNIGGRVNAIAIDQTNDNIMYVRATARGGVFKTINGGNNWIPIFDNQAFLSIGLYYNRPQRP